jgi:hypothetical protein
MTAFVARWIPLASIPTSDKDIIRCVTVKKSGSAVAGAADLMTTSRGI